MVFFERLYLKYVCGLAYYYWKFVCKGQIEARHNLWLETCPDGFIAVANHRSYFDGLVIWWYLHRYKKIDIRFIAKEKMFKHWFFGSVVRGNQSLKISDTRDAILDRNGYKELLKSKHICIFPEGGRNENDYKQGAGILSKKLNLPIVPFALVNFHKLKNVKLSLQSCETRIVILNPIYPDNNDELTKTAMERIETICEEQSEKEKK